MAFAVVKKSELATARMEEAPLSTLLSNLNELYLLHRPQLIDVAYTSRGNDDRSREYEFVVQPSADGLPYRFVHRWLQQVAGDCTITVQEYTAAGGYNTINSPSPIAGGGGAWGELSELCTIDAAATRIRIGYTNTDNYFPAHVLAFPEPSAVPSVPVASGFFGYNSGLWTASNAPCTTEFLNRCKASAVAVLRDRRQQAFSFCQDRSGSPKWPGLYDLPSVAVLESVHKPISRFRISLPGQTRTALRVHCLGHTDNPGASIGTAYVRQVGGGDANSSIGFILPNTVDSLPTVNNAQSGSLVVFGDTPELEIGIRVGDATGVYRTTLNSFVGYWRPGD